jgi:DNA-binding response OmpR family regulator
MRPPANECPAPRHRGALIVLGDRGAPRMMERCLSLEEAGFRVEIQPDALHALDRAREDTPAAIVVRWSDQNDAWLATMRQQCDEGLPVRYLALTPLRDDEAVDHCIAAGADMVADVSCSPRELAARTYALLRRPHTRAFPSADRQDVLGDLCIDPAARIVRRGPTRVRLSHVEFNLLLALLRSPGQVVARTELHRVACAKAVGLGTIDKYMWSLRKKIEPDIEAPRYILRFRGAGYMVPGPADPSPADPLR